METIAPPLKNCYFNINSKIYNAIKARLNKSKIGGSLNDISFILKGGYYARVLNEINGKGNTIARFNEEFYSLYKLLENDLTTITFKNRKNGKECIIRSKRLITIITEIYKHDVLRNDNAVDILAKIELDLEKKRNKEGTIAHNIAFQLLLYIQTKTKYSSITNNDEILSYTFSNNICELVYDLMIIGKIINEKDTHSAKDLIRNWVKRYISKNPKYIHYFILLDVKEIFDPNREQPFLEHLQKMIDIRKNISNF